MHPRFLALMQAEAWGQHPEDVYLRPGGLRWAGWYAVYRDERQKAKKD